MDTARYVLAVLVLVAYPPPIAFWLITHPFIGFWRKLGPGWTYAILLPVLVAIGWGMWTIREPLLATEFGTNYGLWPVALIAYAISIVIEVKCRKQLAVTTLIGVPEFSKNPGGGKLLTGGIYGRVRHPRYVGAVFGALGTALLTNYLTTYVIAVLLIPVLYVIVVLEERELRARFGDAYVRYAERVPRFVPKRRR